MIKWTWHVTGGPRLVYHQAVCVGNQIYSFGGYNYREKYRFGDPISVFVLDPETLRWAEVDYEMSRHVPSMLRNSIAVAYGSKVYSWNSRFNNIIPAQNIACFDTETLDWSSVVTTGRLPYVNGHISCIVGNKIYTFGCQFVRGSLTLGVCYLNLETMAWTLIVTDGERPPPIQLYSSTSVAIGDKIYLFGDLGGINGGATEKGKPLHCFDTIDHSWVALNPSGKCPLAREHHTAWAHNGYLYIFGGFTKEKQTQNYYSGQYLNDLYRYSVKENHWQQLELGDGLPRIRRNMASIIYQDKVFIFGGIGPIKNSNDAQLSLTDYDDLHVLDLSATLQTSCIVSVLQHGLDYSMLPVRIKSQIKEIQEMTRPNGISGPENSAIFSASAGLVHVMEPTADNKLLKNIPRPETVEFKLKRE